MSVTDIRHNGRDYRVYRAPDGKITRVTVHLPEWENKPGTWEGVPLSDRIVGELDKITN